MLQHAYPFAHLCCNAGYRYWNCLADIIFSASLPLPLSALIMPTDLNACSVSFFFPFFFTFLDVSARARVCVHLFFLQWICICVCRYRSFVAYTVSLAFSQFPLLRYLNLQRKTTAIILLQCRYGKMAQKTQHSFHCWGAKERKFSGRFRINKRT